MAYRRSLTATVLMAIGAIWAQGCTPEKAGDPAGVGSTTGNVVMPAPLLEGDAQRGNTGTITGYPTGGTKAGGDTSGGPTSAAQGPKKAPTPKGNVKLR